MKGILFFRWLLVRIIGLPLKQRHQISLQSSERSIFARQTTGVGRFFTLLPWTWYPRVPQSLQDKREASIDSFLCYLGRDIREFRSVTSDTIHKRLTSKQFVPVVPNAYAIKFNSAALHLSAKRLFFCFTASSKYLFLRWILAYMSIRGLTTVTSTQRSRPCEKCKTSAGLSPVPSQSKCWGSYSTVIPALSPKSNRQPRIALCLKIRRLCPAQDNSWCPCLSEKPSLHILHISSFGSVSCPVRRRRAVRYSRGVIVSPTNGKGRACNRCPACVLELARRSVVSLSFLVFKSCSRMPS